LVDPDCFLSGVWDVNGVETSFLIVVNKHQRQVVAGVERELQLATIRQFQGGLKVVNDAPASLVLLEEPLWTEQSDG